MRIFEGNDLGYSVEDILGAVQEELGFSAVQDTETSVYYVLGSKIILTVKFDEEVKIVLEFPQKSVDISDDIYLIENYSSAIEVATEIRKIIERMTSLGEVKDNEDL